MNDEFYYSIYHAENKYYDPSTRIRVIHRLYGGSKVAECEVVENCKHHVVLREILKIEDENGKIQEVPSQYTFSARKADLFFGREIEW